MLGESSPYLSVYIENINNKYQTVKTRYIFLNIRDIQTLIYR